MKAAQLLTKLLENEGTEVVFGYPGGAIMPVYDALLDSKLRHVFVRHEQAAVFAADGYARATGNVGVCIATSGPGATNLITGIANAYLDSVPVVAITGQVSTTLMGTDAFQEVDIVGMTLPVVKHSFLVRHAEDLPQTINDAFRLARSGRPGPVLIDLPKDVASTTGEFRQAEESSVVIPSPDPEAINSALDLIQRCSKPVIYAGGGIGIGGAVAEFRRFVETTGIPVVTTLKGLGVLPYDHDLFLGLVGMHGSKAANMAVQDSDLLLCIGARFDDRATGKLSEFAPHAKVIHLDVDSAEVGKLRRPEVRLVGELTRSLEAISFPINVTEWRNKCLSDKAHNPRTHNVSNNRVDAPRFLQQLSQAVDDPFIVTCDVGQHQMWVAQHFGFSRPDQHLTSGGLGAMGYGLPAAIGAQIGRPSARVINISGDGSIMMNLQELATVARYKLPLRIVLLDNQALGLVRQWQELFFDRRYSEVDLSDNPDFVRVAESFGIPAFSVKQSDDISPAIERIVNGQGPMLAHVEIDQEANVWPLVPPNKSNANMLEGAPR